MRIRYLLFPVAALLTACSAEVAVPAQFTETASAADIYPDYRDIVVPPNIAPLNIKVKGGKAFVGVLSAADRQVVAGADEDGKLFFDSTEWRALLDASKGKDLKVEIYAEGDNGWVKHPAYRITVAAEPIDRYLSYRLIEPSYELYRRHGIYQRDLSTFDQRPVYENNVTYDTLDNHCVNCHNFRNNSTDHMLFHVRAAHGGTVFIENGKARKVNMKCDSILSSTVYPAWHPTHNYIAFATNQTGQSFHMADKQKVEVVDYGSDLVLYDVEANTLTNVMQTDSVLETFPCWSPDGTRIFYCAASVPKFSGKKTEERMDIITTIYDSVRYNLMSMPFDPVTRTFGAPRTEMDCAAAGKSATVPRVSSDGRYLLFTLGDFGQFHIWHNSADLYVKDLATGEIRPLDEANSPGPESFHSWSSNGRWMAFASRRDDGSYSRAYIAYFDREGRAHKAFLLPQYDPEQNLLLLKSYNVPELSKNAVSVSAEEIERVIYAEPSGKVTYKSVAK